MARVLIIGDTHCPGMRRGYVEFLLRTAEHYDVTRVVHIGDLVDWHAISFHDKHPSLSDASKEYRKALHQVQKLVKAFPKTDWLIGNHDALTVRQAAQVGLPPEVLRDHADLWEVPWKVHPRFAKLEIGGVLYSHGETGRGGMDAASRQAADNFQSTVIGHFHSQAGVKWFANEQKCIFGMSVGCGIDRSALQFNYGIKFHRKPILGCGVVIPDAAFFVPWKIR